MSSGTNEMNGEKKKSGGDHKTPAGPKILVVEQMESARAFLRGTMAPDILNAVILEARDGWTELVITPDRGINVVDGLLTGWHEPEASHLLMLEAIAGRPLLEAVYSASLQLGYLWHEFGDVALILP